MNADLNMARPARPLEARISELGRRLTAQGLRLPRSDKLQGEVHIEMIAGYLSVSPHRFGTHNGGPSEARAHLNALASKIGTMPADEFQRAVVDEASLSIPIRGEDRSLENISEWAADVRAKGLKVPEGRLGCPNYAVIGRLAGLAAAPPEDSPVREVIDALGRDVGFMAVADYRIASGHKLEFAKASARNDLRRSVLQDFLLQEFIGPDRPLPAHPRNAYRPNYRKLCTNAGIVYYTKQNLGAQHEINAAIDRAALLVGIGADAFRPTSQSGSVTFAQLREFGLAKIAAEDDPAQTTLNRFASALNKVMTYVGKSGADYIGAEILGEFLLMAEAIAQSHDNVDTRRHWMNDARRWHRYAVLLVPRTLDDLPATFQGAMQVLVRSANEKSLAALLRKAGLPQEVNRVRAWLSRGNEPHKTDIRIIERLEDHFSVPPGTLSGRISRYYSLEARRVMSHIWPPSLNTPAKRTLAKPLLPADFAYLSADERERIGLTIMLEAATSIPFRKKMETASSTAGRWRLNPMPHQLQREMDELFTHKTELIPDTPRAQVWAQGTIRIYTGALKEFYSALALDPDKGGLGIPKEHLTLGLLVSSSIFKWYVNFKARRAGGTLNTGVRTWLGLFASLTTPGGDNKSVEPPGYLHSRPELAHYLKPVYGFLSEQEIEALKNPDAWSLALADFNQKAWSIFGSVRGSLKFSRDPHQPILPILNSPRPLDALIGMLRSAHADLPSLSATTPFKRAIAVRRFVTILILVRTAVRLKNIVGLTWTSDNTGHLRRDEIGWWVEIPADQFKNKNGSYFGGRVAEGRAKRPFSMRLPSQDTAILDEYVTTCRSVLLKGKTSVELLINRNGRGVSPETVQDDMYYYTWIHLVYHETTDTGIKGVEVFGPHAVRAIIPTHILKTTGNVPLAADSVHDTVRTILAHYAQFLPQDRSRHVAEFFEADLGSAAWDGNVS